jgi:hypothetical protein
MGKQEREILTSKSKITKQKNQAPESMALKVFT